MNSRHARSIALLAIALSSAHAAGAQPAASPAPPATTQPAITSPKAVIDRAISAYAALKSYQDTLLHTFEFDATIGGKPAGGGGNGERAQTQQPRLLFARDAGFSLTNIPLEVYADRRTVWLRSPETAEYIERQFAEPQTWRDAAGEYAGIASAHPILELLAGSVTSASGFPGIDQPIQVADDNVNGVPVRRVDGKASMPELPSAVVPVRLWFSTQSGLLLRMQTDLRPMYERIYANAPANMRLDVRAALVTLEFTAIRTDGAIDPLSFTFKPAANERLVSDFAPPSEDPAMVSPDHLLGRLAPPTTASVLGGGSFNLPDFRNKVVVLDFWSTSCAPCAASLAAVERLAARYKGDRAIVAGINQDDSASFEKVRKFVADRALTMPILLDPGGTLGRSYGAGKIPLTVVIDQRGIVRFVHTGAPEASADAREKAIAAQIEQLLAQPPAQP